MSDRIYSIDWKPTMYNGVLYRSRLEAKWACFFDAMGIIHTYECKRFIFPEHYGTETYVYTPDFCLLSCGYDYIEVKPTSPTPVEWDKCKALSLMGFKVAIFTGSCTPDARLYLLENGHQKYIPRSSAFLQQCFQFKLNGRQGETIAALKVVLGKGNYSKAFRKAWEFKA